MTDEQIVAEVRKLYIYESMLGNKFKAQAYSFTADMLEMIVDIPDAVKKGDVQSIKGIGPATVTKIKQLIKEGKIDKLEAYKTRVPEQVLELTNIEGVGPVTAYKLYSELGVVTFDDLKTVCSDGKLGQIPRMNSKIQSSISDFLKTV